MEGTILSITVRQRDTWNLGLKNILGYHPWYLKKVKPSKESVIRDHYKAMHMIDLAHVLETFRI